MFTYSAKKHLKHVQNNTLTDTIGAALIDFESKEKDRK